MVYYTHMKPIVRELHDTMLDLTSMMNQPQRDSALLKAAGVSIDRALFPLLVYIERKGPVGVGDLADTVGRDYSTVSRQVAKLEESGLIRRQPSKSDSRVNQATITASGKKLTDALDKTRQRLADQLLKNWKEQDLKDLSRLMRQFVNDLTDWNND